jgi:hypothetical protein
VTAPASGDARALGLARRAAVPLIALAASTFVGGASALPAQVTCFDRPATVVGTEGDDLLIGTAGDDVIVALGGNDQVTGLNSGTDTICGGLLTTGYAADWREAGNRRPYRAVPRPVSGSPHRWKAEVSIKEGGGIAARHDVVPPTACPRS